MRVLVFTVIGGRAVRVGLRLAEAPHCYEGDVGGPLEGDGEDLRATTLTREDDGGCAGSGKRYERSCSGSACSPSTVLAEKIVYLVALIPSCWMSHFGSVVGHSRQRMQRAACAEALGIRYGGTCPP